MIRFILGWVPTEILAWMFVQEPFSTVLMISVSHAPLVRSVKITHQEAIAVIVTCG
ncbi:MAG: hypothetical protein A4E47_01734 [Methanosaeta sp. PtaU1.Bin028]|nr:MAG: hypothetical protein A4E47_01734 [Methanosaeta sp. PtaU1.Bin028]